MSRGVYFLTKCTRGQAPMLCKNGDSIKFTHTEYCTWLTVFQIASSCKHRQI